MDIQVRISFTLEELEVLDNALSAEALRMMRKSTTYGTDKGQSNPDLFQMKAYIASRLQIKSHNAGKRLREKLNEG